LKLWKIKESDRMAKKRIYTIAKENSVDNQVVLDAAAKLGIDVKNHMSSVDETSEKKIVGNLKGGKPAAKSVQKPAARPAAKATSNNTSNNASKEKTSENHQQSGDHKTKIKITAVRRDPNKNKGHYDHNRNNGNGNGHSNYR